MKIGIIIPVYISKELHLEFTEKTIESIATFNHQTEVLVITNHCAEEYRERLNNLPDVYTRNLNTHGSLSVLDNPNGNCLSAAWNLGLDYFSNEGPQKADYILIPNNDIIFHPELINNLVSFAQDYPDFYMWTANEHANMRTIRTEPIESEPKKGTYNWDEHPHFSCFMVSPESMKRLYEFEKDTSEKYPGRFDEEFRPAYFEDGDMHNRILRAKGVAAKTASAVFYHFGSRTIKVDEELNMKNKRTYEAARDHFIDKWGWDPHGRVVDNDDPIRYKIKQPYEKTKQENKDIGMGR